MDQESQKIFEVFLKEKQETKNLQDKIARDFANSEKRIVSEIRNHWRDLVISAGTIMGISLFGQPENEYYFIAGMMLLVILIITIVFYMREILDVEANRLQRVHDFLMDTTNKSIELIDGFLNKGSFTDKDWIDYTLLKSQLPSLKQLKENLAKTEFKRQKRISGNDELNYAGELFTTLFISGLFLIIVSKFFGDMSPLIVIPLVVLMFLLPLTDPSLRVVGGFSKLAGFLKKKKVF